ncbi:MAG: glycosyl transferase [Candidatus Competibacteraceae bacterium]|nr:MAG: glycosyl transferase [Candidatus Competibacteraceae bacterium]
MQTDLIQHAQAVAGHVLAQGRYATFLTAAGTGYSAWGPLALTGWTADPTEGGCGHLLYLRDLDDGAFWSLGQQPILQTAERYEIHCRTGWVELLRQDGTLETRLEVCIAPDADLELRRITLRNLGDRPRRIELTSYAEVVLNGWAAHAAHPTFSKLFIQTEWVAAQRALLARRRPRSPDESPCWLVHALADGDDRAEPVEYETDRVRFIGRGHSMAAPQALTRATPLSGTVGNVLDPIVSLRRTVRLAAGESAQVSFLLGAAAEREAALALLTPYRDSTCIEAAFQTALASPAVAFKPPLPVSPAPTAPLPDATESCADTPSPEETLQFWNGYGGFNATGDEYVIRIQANDDGRPQLPPQPWINVVANPQFGFIVSETGAGYTWSRNSRENRLTPWYNDPVLDPHGEALYLRDEDSGAFWSPLPGPVAPTAPYETRHGFGYSRYRHASHGLTHDTWLFAPREDPVKITRVRLHNASDRPRRLSLFAYARLVLGVLPGDHAADAIIEREATTGALLAENHNREFAGRMVFAAMTPLDGVPIHVSGDRASFIGRCGNPARPAALSHDKTLNGRLGMSLDPCFALQITLQLEPGATVEYAYLLGEAESRDEVRRLIGRYRQDGAVAAALAEVRGFWRHYVSTVQVQTPTPALDLMLNGWLAYQTLSCRLWGRSAFYQSGGAFGFRDQLQDASALLYYAPELTRQQLLLHASHQFREGDVLHWWHPPVSCGIRTRFSDDLLWLPYLAAFYARSTGDWSLLSESVRFIEARPLADDEDEAFLTPKSAGESASLYEHCCRAIDRSLTQGQHGLPLMGAGDWNDGMNRVGREGHGESVWLGFFLYRILSKFIPVCGQHGDHNRARRYAAFRSHLASVLDEHGWDGAWYRRAWYDDGAVLGSAASDECQIDALAQAWAVISQAAPAERAAAALDAVEQHLISEPDQLIRLLTPPFEHTPHDPGYIKGYVAGVRENGGQYTHAALWVVRAMARLGRRNRAAPLLEMLNPINHALDPAAVATYRIEPYVAPADIYGAAPHVGRGGWSWYTGSAGWMLRVALESILGLKLSEGHTLRLRPCIPDDWPGFSLRYRLPDGDAIYDIEVRNPHGRAAQVTAVEIDDRPGRIESGAACIPLFRDGHMHHVTVTLDDPDWVEPDMQEP